MRRPGYGRTIPERFGFLAHLPVATRPASVWLHAISVGEVNSAAELIRRLRPALPGVPLFVSTGTLAGRELAEARLKSLADGLFFAPFDYVWCVRRVQRAVQPGLVIVLETEIWPNLWRETKKSGAGLLVVNGRISDQAFPKYRQLKWAFGAVLSQPDLILTQTEHNVGRYQALGGDPEVRYGGNLKYDIRPGECPPGLRDWIGRLGASFIWIAASTMPPVREGDVDEDAVVLDAFEALARRHPGLLMIHVPRRPERFDAVAEELRRRGIRCVRRSRMDGPLDLPGVLLLDSIGDLAGLFELAGAVFMGGTLADRGGHNILEPAIWGKPVISGPNLQNFAEIAAEFRAAGALVEIASPGDLRGAVERMILDPAARAQIGGRGREVAQRRSGAVDTAVQEAVRLYSQSIPVAPVPVLARLALTPLSWIWTLGGWAKGWWAARNAGKLPAPVVSVGGITMGGAGKTPVAIAVARLLRASGAQPAFLTRGYRRKSSGVLVLAAGAEAAPAATGDEAQLLLRSGLGPVGICGDRGAAGLAVWEQFRPDVFILDDGFQHRGVSRDADLLVIDVLSPFGGAGVFPLGRLREPKEALRRASAFILARTQAGRHYPAIEAELRRWNPDAPVFRSRLVPSGWTSLSTGDSHPPDLLTGKPAFAFCGLGNPASFYQTLGELGVKLAGSREFPDHHRYERQEIDQILANAAELGATPVTTAKDAVNIPDQARVLFLDVEVQFDQPDELRAFIRQRASQ